MSEWISVEDKLPKKMVKVLIFDEKNKSIHIAILLNGKPYKNEGDQFYHWNVISHKYLDRYIYFDGDEINYWMPLPNPPEIKE